MDELMDELRDELRQKLRALKASTPEPVAFDTDAAPGDPLELFREWLASAIEGGVAQPHAIVLATANSGGAPSARTVLLKDLTDEGFWFASLSSSPKGRDLAENPRCSLLLYWREQGRQIRVDGEAKLGSREASANDFLARHPKARAAAIAGTQSEPIVDEQNALDAATRVIESDETYVPSDWHTYIVEPRRVEFWQATPDHGQARLKYERLNHEWNAQVIWP